MELSHQGVGHREVWEKKGYILPQYDREKVRKATEEAPFWIHFGAGNIFRAFQAAVVQDLLNDGTLEKGLIVAEGFDYEIIEKINRPHDDYSILVTLKADGSVEKTVVGSVVESRILDPGNREEYSRLKDIFGKDSLQIVSFTITEKGYSLVNPKGETLPEVEKDFISGPQNASSYMGKIASLLYMRYQSGEKPVAMVSMDNCSHNGDKLHAAICTFAKEWQHRGLSDNGFVDYINDEKRVSFPWTMIDKITPRPDDSVKAILQEDGLTGMETVMTSKNSYVAPFVNAEECQYLVIEDKFPNGRPRLEKGGIIFTQRETVEKAEKMKVCTCLNPLHTSLAIFGCLLGYKKISSEMDDPELKKLVEIVGYQEGLPVAVDPGILDPGEFLDLALNVRIPNPFMPDTPQRIATDTSQKLAVRFGRTIKAYETSEDLDVADLKIIPLVLAGWLRYLMAVDDNGNTFKLSPDPMLDTVCPYMASFRLGEDAGDLGAALKPILENTQIFGVNLYEVGMAEKICGYFQELIQGRGSVRETLKKYTKQACTEK